MPPFSLIAALAHDGALGQQGGLPWPVLAADRQWFRLLTTSKNPYTQALCIVKHPGILTQNRRESFWPSHRNAIILGRRTYQSLPAPLEWRTEIVLTSQGRLLPKDTHSFDTFQECLLEAECFNAPHIWVIGGAAVYAEALQHPGCQALYITQVDTECEADTFWPESRIEWAMGRMQTWGDTRNRARDWHRTHSSAWIEEPDRPEFRFGIWHPQAD